MINIEESHIRDWSLAVSDSLSSKFKLNIFFKDIIIEESPYQEFLKKNDLPLWAILCKQELTNNLLLITTTYNNIISTTTLFFSNECSESLNKNQLSFTESIFAKEITNDIISGLEKLNLDLHLLKHEPNLDYVHPFQGDDLIKIYTLKWYINKHNYGELNICHSHAL